MKSTFARDIYSVWAPSQSIWAQWAKPVLFATLRSDYSGVGSTVAGSNQQFASILTNLENATPPASQPTSGAFEIDPQWLDAVNRDRTAIVVNLPGTKSVDAALTLARAGYQPVPLYNCSTGPSATIPVEDLQKALVDGAAVLKELNIDPKAPPAFLLDSRRMRGVIPPAPERFDNRWIIFPQDMPSGNFLQAQGIRQVVVLQDEGMIAQNDLEQALSRWKKSGLTIVAKNPSGTEPERPMVLRRPSLFFGAAALALLMVSFGGRRSNVGGFGALIPDPTKSSTGG